MSLKIEQGLFNSDFIDYHAILGIPVDADPKEIRKRYLKIARRLHPDSFATEDEADRDRASELLSKLVNPAYEKISQEKNYTEYCVVLRLKGQQALKQQDTVVLVSEASRNLASTNDLESYYKSTLKELAEQQYQSLKQTLELTGQISELNLVYLMRKEARGESMMRQPVQSDSKGSVSKSPPAAVPKPPPTKEAIVGAYLRRAKEFEAKQDFPRAIIELREAIQIDPRNSNCHSRLGAVYLKTNQGTMAKIYFNQALSFNPQDAIALEGKRQLEAAGGQAAKPQQVDANAKGRKASKSSGGLFGLFGGKKE